MLKGYVSKNDYQEPQNLIPNYDKNGNIFYTDKNGNRINNQVNFVQNLANNARAFLSNANDWLNNSNPDSDDYKQKANIALSLATLPMGAGTKATQAIAKPLVPYVGRQIANTIGQGVGAGAVGGAVEGFGRGLINEENPILTSAQGMLGGGIFGGLGGYALGNIGKQIARRNLVNNAINQQNYIDNYIKGLSDNAEYVGKASRFKKELADFKGAKQGIYNSNVGQQQNFIGKNAKTADLERLKYAKKYIKEGHGPERIRQDFGWFQGKDGKWRYEIPSGKVKPIRTNEVYLLDELSDTLDSIYDSKELYDAYPELAKTKVHIKSFNDEYQDYYGYIDSDNEIYLNNNLLQGDIIDNPKYLRLSKMMKKLENTNEYKKYKKIETDFLNDRYNAEKMKQYQKACEDFYNSDVGKYYEEIENKISDTDPYVQLWNKDAQETLPHEIQHIIQDKEGFAVGGNIGVDNYENYLGEIEAEDVANRVFMTEEQRRKTPPKSHFNSNSNIIKFNNKKHTPNNTN